MGQYDLFRKIAQSNLTSKERQINEIQRDILNDFDDSPSFETITIASTSYKVRIVEESSLNKNPNKKRILMKPGDSLGVGNTILWNFNNWLVTDLDDDNSVYCVGIIEKCNNTLTIQTGVTETITGYDSMGRPIITSTPTYTSYPCIELSSLSVNRRSNLNEPINLPFGRTLITIALTDKVYINLNYTMNSFQYKVIDCSYSRTGLVDFMADKIV